MITLLIYFAIGLSVACWYVWQLGGPDSVTSKDLIRVFLGWLFLWPIIIGFIVIWKSIERLAK